MIPTLKDSHLVVYVFFLSVLVATLITGTVLFDDKVQMAKDGDKWGLVLTVAQRATPLAIGVLVINVIVVEFGYFLVGVPRSHRIRRRLAVIQSWIERRRREREEKEERLEQQRRLREIADKERLFRNVRDQVRDDRAHADQR